MELFEAIRLFGFEHTEYSRRDILKRYRILSFKFHPDHGGNNDDFNRLTDAFNILSKECKDLGGKEKTIEGKKLSDLGKGYPITESAKTCDDCDGDGYRMYKGGIEFTGNMVKCPTCEGVGLFSFPCKKCGGTGKYFHPKARRVVGECNLCHGTGKFYPKNKNQSFFGFFEVRIYIPCTQLIGIPCKVCIGSKFIPEKTDGKPFYTVCRKCEGIGEEKMWNPVLPRGLFNE